MLGRLVLRWCSNGILSSVGMMILQMRCRFLREVFLHWHENGETDGITPDFRVIWQVEWLCVYIWGIGKFLSHLTLCTPIWLCNSEITSNCLYWCYWHCKCYVSCCPNSLLSNSRSVSLDIRWEESGKYDPGMLEWGGENLEQSMRVWMCGGEIFVVRDSFVGHIFDRPPKPNPGVCQILGLSNRLTFWVIIAAADLRTNSWPKFRRIRNVRLLSGSTIITSISRRSILLWSHWMKGQT